MACVTADKNTRNFKSTDKKVGKPQAKPTYG
jgi:hypothetical protein